MPSVHCVVMEQNYLVDIGTSRTLGQCIYVMFFKICMIPPKSIHGMMIISFRGWESFIWSKTLWQLTCLTKHGIVWWERNIRIFEEKLRTEETGVPLRLCLVRGNEDGNGHLIPFLIHSHIWIAKASMKISVITDISVLRFYRYIDGYFGKKYR